ncbi:hypothetical protein VV02_02705 [Luteipulveratus mongoliensis]|uniref:Uncharacterized protein n=2 Tax=Luteipulveratus mongoliensis TaxID=571913 RepID=A0A0K1JEK1_9MICO|nr:hypothetical protein VV02_02705 [Luteipulveratus mongoliensis]
MLEDAATVIESILQKAKPSYGDVVVARVDADSQDVVGTHIIEQKVPFPTEWSVPGIDSSVSEAFCEAAHELAPPHVWSKTRGGGLTAVFITVVCREGRAIDSRDEWTCIRDWRYSNHLRDGFDGDVYVVTPHGWAGLMDRRAGHHPRLVQQPRLRAV